MKIPNQAIHDQLLSMGFKHEFFPADWEDVGDAETGPMVHGHPAWHEYENGDEIIIVDDDGFVVQREDRDLELEKFLNSLNENGRLVIHDKATRSL